ncbi:MAG: glycosyltransferase family 4 protein [Candidatus Aenigmatarchaeota archaeon]
MVKLTVDYYKKGEMFGGVQEFLHDFKHIYPDFKEISFANATNAIIGNAQKPEDFAFFEIETSSFISQYLDKYEKIFKPDVIVKNSIVGTWKKHLTPMICIIQDNNILGPEILHKHGYYNMHILNRYRQIFTKLQEMTMEKSDMIVASSNHLKNTYEKEFGMDIKVIENGINTEMFKPLNNKNELREKYGIPKDKVVGITTTGFLPIKGWHIQAKLCHDFPDVFWIVIMKNREKQQPKLKNIKIFYRIQRELLPELLNTADFFILPSAIEGCNMSAMEAMSCGLNTITTNSGYFWNPYMEKDIEIADFGIRVKNWVYEDYKKAVEEMLSGNHTFDPRKHVENNGIDFNIWIGKWKKVIKKVINEKG